jgi:hypothetical protein
VNVAKQCIWEITIEELSTEFEVQPCSASRRTSITPEATVNDEQDMGKRAET